MDKPIPEQYKTVCEELIHDIGNLADQLYPFMTELGGNSVEMECGEVTVTVRKKGVCQYCNKGWQGSEAECFSICPACQGKWKLARKTS